MISKIEIAVISVISICALVVILPSFVGQTNRRGPRLRGVDEIGAINRAQEAYLIGNSSFADTVEKLELGIPSESDYYSYIIKPIGDGDPTNGVQTIALAKEDDWRNLTAAVLILPDGTYTRILCRSKKASKDLALPVKLVDNKLQCPIGYYEIE